MDYRSIRLERDGAIARLELGRPEKLNSLNVEMRDELLDALEELRTDERVRCVILEAAGRAFCAGQDLNERTPVLEGVRVDLGDALDAGANRIVRLLASLPQPVICAVQGAAVGAGAGIALACDIVVAARSTRFDFSFLRIGLVPDAGVSWCLPRLLGPARASGMVLLAEAVTADEAERAGMIWKCVEDGELTSSVEAMAASLCQRSPTALRLAKQALRAASENGLDAQLDLEADFQREAGFSDEYRLSLMKFFRRRPPE